MPVHSRKRTEIETRLAILGKIEPQEEPKDRAAKITYVLREVEEALRTPELEVTERNQILSTIIHTVVPDENEKYRLCLRGDAETVQSISMFCCG